MFVQRRTIGSRLSLSILAVLILVHAGCGGPTSTPSPTPTTIAIATPAVTILRKPPDPEVPTGGQVALAAEATGRNLKIQWSVDGGTLSNSEGPSTIYTAPDEPGSDTVDVTVTSNGWGITERVIFTVVAPPLETLAPTNTPTVRPTLTQTPTSAPTNSPAATPTLTKTPTSTSTATTAVTATATASPTPTRGSPAPSPTPAAVTALLTTETGYEVELSELVIRGDHYCWAQEPEGIPTQSGVEVSWDYIQKV